MLTTSDNAVIEVIYEQNKFHLVSCRHFVRGINSFLRVRRLPGSRRDPARTDRLAARRADGRSLPHFQRAASLEPNYVLNFAPIHQGVWTYVGRAYYDAGNLGEARKALERARLDESDDLAKLYLGLILARAGDREGGSREIQTGLRRLHDWLDYMEQYHPDGRFWDPGRYLRSEIQKSLTMLSRKDVRWPELISSGEMLGKKLEEEIELVRRSQVLEQTKGENGGD